MATATNAKGAKPRVLRLPGPRYFELVRVRPLRHIENEAEHDRALAMIDALVDKGPKRRTRDENDYMNVLADLIYAYDEKHYADPPVDPAEVLRDYIEEPGLKKKDLAATAGIGLSTLSEIAAGKRPMTRNHIERLAKALGVKPSVFID